MRLLPTSPGAALNETTEFLGETFPKYAILSHTWGPDEVSLKELNLPSIFTPTKHGFDKIRRACSLASQNGLEYAWVDTCCIDKDSSAELTEAINSMYAWYAGAEVCYAYLNDLAPGTADDLETALPRCRWFTRGWTLQELIAPRQVIFFDRDWNERGTKHDLSPLLARITGIPIELLQHREELEKYSVAMRMCWAATRETTRVEDVAYCLLGIFGVHMSLIYGEGMKAFYRLQEAIVLATADLSIFSWTDNDSHRELAPIMAERPIQFANCGRVTSAMEDNIYRELTINTRGIQTEASLVADVTRQSDAYQCVFDPFCADNGQPFGIALRKIGGGRYMRFKPHMRVNLEQRFSRSTSRPWFQNSPNRMLVESVTLATKVSPHFPFGGRDAVLGNRHCALRVNWLDEEFNRDFTLNEFRPIPRSHWDPHDKVFFSTSIVSKSWCSFFAYPILRVGMNDSEQNELARTVFYAPVGVFVSCHFWNIGCPKVIVASLYDLDSPTTVLLEAQLDRIRFESNRQASALIVKVLDGKIPHIPDLPADVDDCIMTGKAIVQTAVIKSHDGSIPLLQNPHHEIADKIKDGIKVEVAAELHAEERPEICSLPMWRLDVGCRVLEEDGKPRDAAQAS